MLKLFNETKTNLRFGTKVKTYLIDTTHYNYAYNRKQR